jgi:O-antigen/teichoic acid export membrane protein
VPSAPESLTGAPSHRPLDASGALPEAPRGGNLLSLAAVQALRMGAGVAVNLMLLRALGVEGLGVHASLTALVALAAFGAGLGIDRLLRREIARDPASAGPRVAAGLAASAALSGVTGAAIVAWVALADGRREVVLAAVFAAVALGLQTLAAVPVAYFHGVRAMGLGVPASLAGRACLVVGTAVAAGLGLGVTAAFAAQALDAAVTLAVTWGVFRRLGVRLPAPRPTEVRALVRDALPFGLNVLFGGVYLGVDVLLLAWLRGDAEVGAYRAAGMLLALFPVLADTLTTGLFPRMARHLGRPDLAGAELRFASRLLLAVSVPAAAGAVLTAEPLLVFLGGPPFAASAVPFAVLAPLLPLRFLNNGYGMTLSALDRQDLRTRGVFLAALLNVLANLVVLPRYGAVGAAATTLLTEAALLAWNRRAVAPLVTGLRLGDTLVRVGLPTAGMAATMLLLPPVHVLLAIAAGGVVYAGAALLTGAVRRDDLRHLRRV